MIEKLNFLFRTKCGNKLTGEVNYNGHYDARKPLKVAIANRGKSCEDCVKRTVWEEKDGELFKVNYLWCPALGLLMKRNGKTIGWPVTENMT